MPATVDTLSDAYKTMRAAWNLPDALRGGTRAMRDASTVYLPREPKEKETAYLARLNRTVLFNAYRDSLERLGSKPFRRPIVVEGLPDDLKPMIADCDGRGTSLTTFARRWLISAIHRGIGHVLVDFMPNPDRRVRADPAAPKRFLPYFVLVDASEVIGFREEADLGPPKLSQLRRLTKAFVDDGDWGEKLVESVTVYDYGAVRRFVKVEDAWVQFGDVTAISIKDRIPIVSANLCETGFMTAAPCLEDLAWINLAHWQSSSDQRACLRYARLPILFRKGDFRDEDGKETTTVTIGPGCVIASSDTSADLKYVEHTGAALKVGQDDLDSLERKMEVLGLAPMMRRTGGETATGKAMDAAQAATDLGGWIAILESALTECFTVAAQWMGVELGDDFKLKIAADAELSAQGDSELRALSSARLNGDISRKTFLAELKRRGVLSDTVDIESEVAASDADDPTGAGDTADPDEGTS